MKKFYLLIAIVMIGNLSNAQFTKGQKLVGPSLSFGFNDYQSENVSNNQLVVDKSQSFIGYIGVSSIKMKTESVGWGVGIYLGYGTYKRDLFQITQGVQKDNTHIVGLNFFRRKFIVIKPKFNFYYDIGGTASAGFNNANYDYINPISTNSTKSSEYGIRSYITPGFTYAIKKNLLIDAALNNIGSIGYSRTTKKQIYNFPTAEQKTTNSSFNASSSLTAGGLLNNFTFSFKWII